LFLILLLFVWRSWDRAKLLPEARSLPVGNDTSETSQFLTMSIPDPEPDLESECVTEECKDVDPVLTYYSREYKNRWTEVIPDMNAVGFTPIAKRCMYPGAPCEW